MDGKKVWGFFRIGFEVWGAFCLICLIFFLVMAILPIIQPNKVDFADEDDVRFILNWGGIASEVKVLGISHSYRSATSPTGDHYDAYCIQLDSFPDEIVKDASPFYKMWVAAPVSNSILIDALQSTSFHSVEGKLDWVPTSTEFNTDRFYLFFYRVSLFNLNVDQLQLIAYDRERKLLYYISSQV